MSQPLPQPALIGAAGGGNVEAAASARAASSYDQVPYCLEAFAQTNPSRLGAIATFFGMTPPSPSNCRVLEIGCAGGGNVIPLAMAMPHSHFLGIDLSGRQIATGQAMIDELGLTNVQFRQADILDLGDELGRFDYIICHGVYSWVPPQVQKAILRLCQRNLSEQGIAYISYNCYPGWHARMPVREMLCHHVRTLTDPLQRVSAARGFLAFLAKSAAADPDKDYAAMLNKEMALLKGAPDTYVLHEHLDEYNEPIFFHEFARRCAEQGLQYLGESPITTMFPECFGAETAATLRRISDDQLDLEQHMDFLWNRMFRQTLLCHAGVKLDRSLSSEVVRSLHISYMIKPKITPVDLQSDAPAQFANLAKQSMITSDRLTKAALVCLAERWPGTLTFADLLAAAGDRLGNGANPSAEDARRLADSLRDWYVSRQLDFTLSPPIFQPLVTQRPVGSPYARLRARDVATVLNMKLDPVTLADMPRLVLCQLDGKRDMDAVAEALAQWLHANAKPNPGVAPMTPEVAGKIAREILPQILNQLAQYALLVQ